MAFAIQPAEPADLPQMVALLGQLFSQEAEFLPDPGAQLRGLSRILADPGQGRLLVARDGQQVLGMVSLLWSTSTALGGPVAWLEDLVVAEHRRGQGLGKALAGAAIGLAKDAGVLRITLLTDADNGPGQALYRSLGFAPSTMLPMRLPLP